MLLNNNRLRTECREARNYQGRTKKYSHHSADCLVRHMSSSWLDGGQMAVRRRKRDKTVAIRPLAAVEAPDGGDATRSRLPQPEPAPQPIPWRSFACTRCRTPRHTGGMTSFRTLPPPGVARSKATPHRRSVRKPGNSVRGLLQCSSQVLSNWCRRTESNRHGALTPRDFESRASASFTTPAGGQKKSIR